MTWVSVGDRKPNLTGCVQTVKHAGIWIVFTLQTTTIYTHIHLKWCIIIMVLQCLSSETCIFLVSSFFIMRTIDRIILIPRTTRDSLVSICQICGLSLNICLFVGNTCKLFGECKWELNFCVLFENCVWRWEKRKKSCLWRLI